MVEPQPPDQSAKDNWNLGAPHWTNRDAHPITGGWHTERRRAIHRHLERFIPELEAAGSILDVGSGGGIGFYFPESLASKVTAIDYARAMLQRNSSARKLQRDIRTGFGEPDNSHTIATQFFVNRYLTPAEQAKELKEFARVLEPNGRVIIVDLTEARGQPDQVAKFDPTALVQTPEAQLFRDWTIEEVRAAQGSPEKGAYQGPLYLLTGVKI